MTLKLLKQRNVKSIIYQGIEYFDIADIKSNHSDLKINIDKIITVNNVKVIKAQHVTVCTEFDVKIKGIFNKK